jgi:DNA-3-methyladenine glycosylase II
MPKVQQMVERWRRPCQKKSVVLHMVWNRTKKKIMIDKNALTHLKKDPVMAELIKKNKLSNWPAADFNNLFPDLIETIIGQQLSGKAANTIISRFKGLFAGKFPTPRELVSTPDEKIRACGTSWAKISYIKNIANAVIDKSLDLDNLPQMTDDEVRRDHVPLL